MFPATVNELGTLDQAVGEKEKITEIVQSLPHFFGAFVMDFSLRRNNLDNIMDAAGASSKHISQIGTRT